MINKLSSIFILTFLLLQAADVLGQADSTLVTLKFEETDSYLIIDEDYSNCIPVNPGEKMHIESGRKTLTIASKYHYDANVTTEFKPGTNHAIIFRQIEIENLRLNAQKSTYATCMFNANVFVISDHDAQVSINGKVIEESVFRITLKNGEYDLISTVNGVKKASVLRVNGVTVQKNYVRPTRIMVYASSILPGAAQIKKREKFKGALFIGVITGLSINSIVYNKKVSQSTSKYNNLRRAYNNSTDPYEILEITKQADKTLNQISNFEKIRNISIVALSSAYVLNILDGIRAPKLGFRVNNINFNPFIDFDSDLMPKAKIEINF